MSQRVVITGIAGFIGSNLADRLLQEGFSVVGIDNLAGAPREQVPAGVEFHQLDVRDRRLAHCFKQDDVVFHLAAKNCISDCQADPVETASINVVGTVNVLEAARQMGVQKVVYAESSALYEGAEIFPTPESAVNPQSFYAVSKFSAMAFAGAYRRFHGMRFTALRYFCVYGPRQDYRRTIPPVISAFIINLLEGRSPTIYGTGEKRRDFIHVDDVNEFHLRCITDPRTDGNAYNLGSGKNYSVCEIFDAIEAVLKTGLRPQFSDDLPGEAEATLADITTATDLGWQPAVSLEKGLQTSVEYIRRHVMDPPIP